MKNTTLKGNKKMELPTGDYYPIRDFIRLVLGDYHDFLVEINYNLYPENHNFSAKKLAVAASEILKSFENKKMLDVEDVLNGITRQVAAIVRYEPFAEGNIETALKVGIALTEKYSEMVISADEEMLRKMLFLYGMRKITLKTFQIIWKTELLNSLIFE